MCTHLSKDPLAMCFPSGLNATLYTGSWWRVNLCTQVPRSTSQRRTVESNDALKETEDKNKQDKKPVSLKQIQRNSQSSIICNVLLRKRLTINWQDQKVKFTENFRLVIISTSKFVYSRLAKKKSSLLS